MLPVIAGIGGVRLSAEEEKIFTRLQPAGYILFSRNIEDAEETRELTDHLRRLTEGPDAPIIAIDQEGGRVVRTAQLGLKLPSAAALAATHSEHIIRQAVHYNARGLHAIGVNTVLAPVLDYGSERTNALGGRCWGSESQQVISYAGVWNRVMQRQGIMTCAKHFPGMGAAQQDPHFSLPCIPGTTDDLLSDQGASTPFMALMPELPSIMAAHVVAQDLDAQRPASLSPRVIQDFLRRQLGFDGVVFTDDLCMGAVARTETPARAAALALSAGCDAPLICHDSTQHLEAAAEAIRSLPRETLFEAERRLERFRLYMPKALPAPRYAEWRQYVEDVRRFCESIPEPQGNIPHSPVQNY